MNQKLSTLMQGLYYPAVLGTGLVLLISRFTIYKSFRDAATDVSLYFGILILIYFSVSFLLNEKFRGTYGSAAFISDFIEIILIFFIFYFLGFFELSYPVKPGFRWFYFLLATIPALEQLWNWAVTAKHFYALSGIAILILFIGGLWGFHYLWFNISMIVVVAGLIGAYIYELS